MTYVFTKLIIRVTLSIAHGRMAKQLGKKELNLSNTGGDYEDIKVHVN